MIEGRGGREKKGRNGGGRGDRGRVRLGLGLGEGRDGGGVRDGWREDESKGRENSIPYVLGFSKLFKSSFCWLESYDQLNLVKHSLTKYRALGNALFMCRRSGGYLSADAFSFVIEFLKCLN